MNQQKIEQYVAGKMDEAEAFAFEQFCLLNPDFARQVEFEQRLKGGLVQVARDSAAEFVRADSGRRWKIGIAASLLMFVAANAYLWQRLHNTQPHLLAAVTAEAPHTVLSMRLALVRGVESMAQLPDGLVRVEIVGLFDPDARYSVALDRPQQKQNVQSLGTLFDLHPASPMTLEILIDGDQLESGSYSLRVRKQASDEDPLDFSFVKP
jgi:hypothetical protein